MRYGIPIFLGEGLCGKKEGAKNKKLVKKKKPKLKRLRKKKGLFRRERNDSKAWRYQTRREGRKTRRRAIFCKKRKKPRDKNTYEERGANQYLSREKVVLYSAGVTEGGSSFRKKWVGTAKKICPSAKTQV